MDQNNSEYGRFYAMKVANSSLDVNYQNCILNLEYLENCT